MNSADHAPGTAGRVPLSMLAWPPAPPCRADVKDRHPPLHSLPLTLCPLPLTLQRACLSTVTPWPQQARPAAPSSCRYHRPGYGQTQSTACSDPTAHRRCRLCPVEATIRCRPFSTVAGAGGLEPLLLVVRPLQAASIQAAPSMGAHGPHTILP